MNTLVYLSGEPGTGKTTLMTELTRRWGRDEQPATSDAPARDWLVSQRTGRVDAVELGRRRDAFSGTDTLPQTAIVTAEAYLRTGLAAREAPLLFAEGARLANRRFLAAARESGWRVILAHLSNPAAAADRRRARAAALGVPEQNPSWVKGRQTAAHNLTATAAALGCTVIGLDAADPPCVSAAILRPVIGALVPL